MFHHVTFNLNGAQTRYEMLDGKQHLVVPTVAGIEGVLEGSEGALFYPADEWAKNPHVWNSKPVVVYHPVQNGEGVSACQPAVLESQGVGRIFNAQYDGRFKMETWLDEDKLRRMASGVLDDIQAGKSVEVSTGLYHELEETTGTHNGKAYRAIVRNIQPDHLAILPDQKGAFSVADGGGLLRNAASVKDSKSSDLGLSSGDIREQASVLLRSDRQSGSSLYGNDYCYICDVYPKYLIYDCDGKCYKVGYKVKNSKVTLDGQPEEVTKVTHYVTANGRQRHAADSVYLTMNGAVLSHNEDQQGPLVAVPKPQISDVSTVMRHQQLQSALKDHYAGVGQDGSWGGWTTDIYDNFVIYYKDGKHYRLPYAYVHDKINFGSEAEEVERTTEYKAKPATPIDGTQSPQPAFNSQGTDMTQRNSNGQPTGNAIHQGASQLIQDATQQVHGTPPGASDGQARKAAVDKLISSHGFKETDRQFLTGLPDDHFARVNSAATEGATQVITPYSYDGIGDRSNVHTATTGNAAGGQQRSAMTENEYIQLAPPRLRAVLTNALGSMEREKTNLVNIICNNRGNPFSRKWLEAQENFDLLRGLAKLAIGGQPQEQSRPLTANYSGQSDIPMFDAPTTDTAPTQNADSQPTNNGQALLSDRCLPPPDWSSAFND